MTHGTSPGSKPRHDWAEADLLAKGLGANVSALKLHRTPRVRLQQVAEILQQLLRRQLLDPVIESRLDTPDRAGV